MPYIQGMGKDQIETPFDLGEPVPAEEVGYARVSDADDQDPDFQIALLKKRGIPDENIFVDRASGRSMARPRLKTALMLMEGRPGWTLVVYKLDRLGRNTLGLMQLAEEFRQKGWNLVSLTEQFDTRTPMGKAFFGMMAVLAQLESDHISERTKAGVARRREKGFLVGRKSKLSLKQFERMEKMLLETTTKVHDIAERFKVSDSFVQKHFPGWRSKTVKEREAWRRAHPFPPQ